MRPSQSRYAADLPDWMLAFRERYGIWPVAGGSGEPPPVDDDGGGDPPPSGEGREEEGGDSVPREEFEALHRRMVAADRNQNEERSARERAEAEANDLRVRLAVVTEAFNRATSDGRAFADLDLLFRVLDTDSIATDDDGQPVEIDRALDALADRYPYLLREHSASAPANSGPPPTQHLPASGRSLDKRKDKDTGYDRKKLAAKYPSLARGHRGFRM